MKAYAIVDSTLTEDDDCYVLTFPVCETCVQQMRDIPGLYDIRPTSVPRELKVTEHNRAETCCECEEVLIETPTNPETFNGGNRFDYA